MAVEKMAPPVCPACGRKNAWRLVGEGRSGYALGRAILMALLLNLVFALLFGVIGAMMGILAGLLCGLSGKKTHIYYCVNCGYRGEYKDAFPENMRSQIPDDSGAPAPIAFSSHDTFGARSASIPRQRRMVS